MRFTDSFRRRVIAEIRERARVVWDPTEPRFHSCGARSDAFHGVAYRLHDASIQQDIRRMWHRWARAVYDYKLKRISRKSKFYADLYFIASLDMDLISTVAHMY
ncbi:hypothetical protein AAVH_34408 [Aphelenchoides avenae]|nr:hypothetical protein AAVH_34408 [Aphelenchus avenae]